MLSHARASGLVSRYNVSRAIGQCAAHHDLWATLAARTAAASVAHGATSHAANGIDEHTRVYWTPIHFAAAFGSADVMEGLLALRPSNASGSEIAFDKHFISAHSCQAKGNYN